ncbi:MAG: GxxExxY protein [Schlesneria sp.]|nr:GxxExxY protein [Schlesneria sp.]
MKHGLNTDKDKNCGKDGKEKEREMGLLHSDITEAIIGAAFEVYGVLGYGFLERVYQRARQVELQSRGFEVETESDIRVIYKCVDVGYYKADLWVNRCVIVELKVAKAYCSDDEPQLLNELKATGVQVGLLVNFGRVKVDFKRFAY